MRNGVVTGGLQNMVLFTVRNGVVTDLGYRIWYFWSEKWVCHVYRAPKTNFSRWEMGLSRIWATKYGIFEVRNGSVTCTELQKPTCHGEKWGCHGCCANIIDLSRWEMGLSRTWATKYGIFEVRNGSVTCTELQKPTCHGEKWGCHGCCANIIDLSRWEMGLSRIWATKYGIFEVRNGSVTCTELQKPTFHGEKWGCHGSGLQNMVFLKWEMGLSRVRAPKTNLWWEMGLSRVLC